MCTYVLYDFVCAHSSQLVLCLWGFDAIQTVVEHGGARSLAIPSVFVENGDHGLFADYRENKDVKKVEEGELEVQVNKVCQLWIYGESKQAASEIKQCS